MTRPDVPRQRNDADALAARAVKAAVDPRYWLTAAGLCLASLMASAQTPAAGASLPANAPTASDDYPVAGMDRGLEEWRPYWTGALAPCRRKQTAGGAILGSAVGGIVGAAIGGTGKSIVTGAIVGGAAGAVLGHQINKTSPLPTQGAAGDVCALARDAADNENKVIDVLTLRFGAECGTTVADFQRDAPSAWNAMRRCYYVDKDAMVRLDSDVARFNHQYCLEMRSVSSALLNRQPQGQGAFQKSLPPAQCPYRPDAQPPLDGPLEAILARMAASVYALDDREKAVLPVEPYRLVDQITDGGSGMASSLYQLGDFQFVVAFRGTVFSLQDLRNLIEDKSWGTQGASEPLITFTEAAALALRTYRMRHPKGHFMLAGHSLGGYAAMVLGSMTHLPAAGFNAPAAAEMKSTLCGAYSILAPAMVRRAPGAALEPAPGDVWSDCEMRQPTRTQSPRSRSPHGAMQPFENSGYQVNFRMQGDWVSVRYGDDSKPGRVPYIGTVCTIKELDPSLLSLATSIIHSLTSHDIVRTAAALVINDRTGRFVGPHDTFEVTLPCMPLE